MHTVWRSLACRHPMSLKATVLAHGWHECAPVRWCEAGRCFESIERIDDDVFRISVLDLSRTVSRPRLRLFIESPSVITAATVSAMIARMRRVLQLDADMTEFYRLCRRHPILRRLPNVGAGRILRSPTMYENICKALCGTNVNWTQAVRMINRIAELGPSFPHHSNLRAWPCPQEILRAGRDYLGRVARLGYRTDYLLAFCRDVREGRLDPEAWDGSTDHASTDELYRQITQVKGIGKATAHYLLGMLGRHDRLSIDSSTVAHVARQHTKGRRPTVREIEKIYEPFGRWRNLVWWFELWSTWERM